MLMRDVICHQSNCLFDVLKEMIGHIPGEELNIGNRPREVLGRQALHILGVFDRYSTKGLNGSKRFGETYGAFGKHFDAEDIPDKPEILTYLERVRAQFEGYINHLSDEFLQKKVQNKRGRFGTNLGKYIYMIRHNTLHLGYMRNMMIGRGYKVGEFK